MESCQGLRTGTRTIRWQQQQWQRGWGGDGNREGIFTDPGWESIGGADLGDQENCEQETLPSAAVWAKAASAGGSHPLGHPGLWEGAGLSPRPPGE